MSAVDTTAGTTLAVREPAVPDVELDVAIVGSGFGASLLAAVLARQGLRAGLVADPSARPGAPTLSTVPYTAELFLTIGERFGLSAVSALALLDGVPPELRAASGPKAHLGFLHHAEGRTQSPDETVQFRVPDEHAEWHPDRAALDAWALGVAKGAGAIVLPACEPGARPDRTVLVDGAELSALVVVDATGPRTAALEGWRTVSCELRRVRPYELGMPQRLHPGTLPWSSGTLTHTFPGGWLQLTPLGDGRCGAGLSVDAARWNADGIAPEELVERVLGALPDVAAQFAGAEVQGAWTDGSGTSPVTDGPGVVRLLPDDGHAPLLARELTAVLTAVLRLGGELPPLVRDASRETTVATVVARREAFDAHQTRLLRAAATATTRFELWNAYLRVWLLSSIVEALALKRTRLDAAASGVWSSTDGVPGPYPFPVPDGLQRLVDESLSDVEDAGAGRVAAGVAADRIFARLRRDPVVPPLYAFGDPDARTYRFGLLRRLRMLAWVTTTAPKDFRRLLTSENVTGDAPGAKG